jgi:DNA (cytosine-5)-methyltransferase 1
MRRVIDLFAGVGGLSLGAARAGFEVAGAVEIDRFALEAHCKNFPNAAHCDKSIADLSGPELLEVAGLNRGEIDGIIGGPPCQGFSSIGKQDPSDQRNHLFGHFFRLVAEIHPKFFLAENVPGILAPKFQDLLVSAFAQVDQDYEIIGPLPVSACDYGAPTFRTRVFFIGYIPDFFRPLEEDAFRPDPDAKAVKVREALRGLPVRISPEWQSEEDGWRLLGPLPDSPFFAKASGQIPTGVGDPGAIERYLRRGEVSGCLGTRHSPEVALRYSQIGAGEKDQISKAVRLNLNGFCPTLRAGTDKEKGSYQAVRPLHPTENRVITPREAARLQGFPDWFVFHRTKWHSFRQIGNSVSPIPAEWLLRKIIESFI